MAIERDAGYKCNRCGAVIPNDLLEEKIGWLVSVGHKRQSGVFFFDGRIKGVSPTHLFLEMKSGEVALLLADITKIEFKSGPAPIGLLKKGDNYAT